MIGLGRHRGAHGERRYVTRIEGDRITYEHPVTLIEATTTAASFKAWSALAPLHPGADEVRAFAPVADAVTAFALAMSNENAAPADPPTTPPA